MGFCCAIQGLLAMHHPGCPSDGCGKAHCHTIDWVCALSIPFTTHY